MIRRTTKYHTHLSMNRQAQLCGSFAWWRDHFNRLKTDNVLFKKEVYYSPSEKKTYILYNPYYTAYTTTENKNRWAVLEVLNNDHPLNYCLSQQAFEIVEQLKLGRKYLICNSASFT